MFDIGGGELLVIGIVALVVIGPKELPGLLRTAGNAMGKVRRMAAEFRGQFDEAMREAELDQAKKAFTDINDTAKSATTSFNPLDTIRNEIKAVKDEIKGTPADTAAASTAREHCGGSATCS
jgi:sec-independent protein translocase protein TatB